jgi:hypothetical protein
MEESSAGTVGSPFQLMFIILTVVSYSKLIVAHQKRHPVTRAILMQKVHILRHSGEGGCILADGSEAPELELDASSRIS